MFNSLLSHSVPRFGVSGGRSGGRIPCHKLASPRKSVLVSSTPLLLGSLSTWLTSGARQFFVVEHCPEAL